MHSLFKPNKQERASLARGDRKLRLSRLRQDGVITDKDCKYCGREICERRGYNPLNQDGAPHKCKGVLQETKMNG